MSIDFLLTSLLVVASPGTGALFTIAAGLSRGARAGLVAAFGCTMGIIPHMVAAIMGLAAVFHASPLAFDIVKYAGAAYLMYMAWMTLKEDGPLQIEEKSDAQPSLKIIGSAVLINLLNPKLPIFFLAFLPQFVSVADPYPAARMLALSAVFMLMTFVVFALYGAFAAFMRGHVLSRPRVLKWLRLAFAAGFVGLGIKLAASQR